MALDFLKSDKKVADEFHAPAYVDPLPKAKKQVLKKLDDVLAKVKKQPSKNIARWYKTKEGKDGASVGINAGSASIVGNTTGSTGNDEIIKADAVAFFNDAKAAIEKGDMDDLIRSAVENNQSETSTSQRTSSGVTREIEPWKVYRRNLSRYGQERADELGRHRWGADFDKVKKDYAANKDK